MYKPFFPIGVYNAPKYNMVNFPADKNWIVGNIVIALAYNILNGNIGQCLVKRMLYTHQIYTYQVLNLCSCKFIRSISAFILFNIKKSRLTDLGKNWLNYGS